MSLMPVRFGEVVIMKKPTRNQIQTFLNQQTQLQQDSYVMVENNLEKAVIFTGDDASIAQYGYESLEEYSQKPPAKSIAPESQPMHFFVKKLQKLTRAQDHDALASWYLRAEQSQIEDLHQTMGQFAMRLMRRMMRSVLGGLKGMGDELKEMNQSLTADAMDPEARFDQMDEVNRPVLRVEHAKRNGSYIEGNTTRH